MPKDKRRSISYRSFVTCDDPKGIVECGTIRKTNISSPQKREQKISKVEVEKKQGNYKDLALAVIEEEKKEMGVGSITRELKSPASFQLLEVSKEADKLNHVISSLSNGKGHQTEDIAKDLLKGAIDLQESLAILSKLQEAKSRLAGLTRKQKLKLEEGRFDGMVKGIMEPSNRFGYMQDEKLHRGFERPRHSVDGFSRKSFDEMRQVVRDSIFRQNVITNPIFEEHLGYRKFGSPDMPSTSSSQSSMIHSSNFAPSDSSISSISSQRKNGKGSNLVVKLMGIESFPSSPRRHREAEKLLKLAKPMYDMDSPRARKPQFSALEVGMKQRTIDEILENLKFKGLLRSNSVNSLTPDAPYSEDFPSINRWIDERPPIVVMKPLRSRYQYVEQPIKPKFTRDAATRTKEMVIKPRSRRGPPQDTVSSDTSNFREKCKVIEVGADFEEIGKSMRKVASSKAKASVNLHQKPQKKQAAVRKASEVVKVIPTRRKGEEKKIEKFSDALVSQDQVILTTPKVKKRKDGTLITKNQTSGPQKMASTAVLDHRTQDLSESPSQREKNRQPAIMGENQRHKGVNKHSKTTVKEEIYSISENDSVMPTVDTMTVDNSHLENRSEASQIQITDYDIDDQSSLSDITEGVAYLHDVKKTSLCNPVLIGTHDNPQHTDDNQSSHSNVTSTSITEHCSVGHLDEIQSPIHEVTLVTTHENGAAVLDTVEEGMADHAKDYQHSLSQTTSASGHYADGVESSNERDNETLKKCFTPRTKLKALLLSSPSFVNRAEELFDLQVIQDSVPHASDEGDTQGDPGVGSTKVLLDYANEVMESLHLSQVCLPLPRFYTGNNPRHSLSLDRLLEEICNGIEDLQCHLKPASENFSSDSLHLLLDRELRFKSGTWDIGWRNMFSQDEVEKVIGHVDKHVLDKLIKEVLADFML